MLLLGSEWHTIFSLAGVGQEQDEAPFPSGTAGFGSGLAVRRGPRRRMASCCGGRALSARDNSARAVSRDAEGAGSAESQAFVLAASRVLAGTLVRPTFYF